MYGMFGLGLEAYYGIGLKGQVHGFSLYTPVLQPRSFGYLGFENEVHTYRISADLTTG